MKAMWLGFAAAALVAVIAHFALDYAGFSAAERQSSAAVRLD